MVSAIGSPYHSDALLFVKKCHSSLCKCPTKEKTDHILYCGQDGFFSFVVHLCTDHAQRVCQSYVGRMYVGDYLDNSIQLRCTKQWLVALLYCMLNLFLMQIPAFILHLYSMKMQDIFIFGHYLHSTLRKDNATKHVLMLECADLSRY